VPRRVILNTISQHGFFIHKKPYESRAFCFKTIYLIIRKNKTSTLQQQASRANRTGRFLITTSFGYDINKKRQSRHASTLLSTGSGRDDNMEMPAQWRA
jgi:hypothetical protein